MSGSGTSARAIATLCVTLIVAAFPLAASAGADTRYAAPDGSGPAASCPQSNPCSLEDAVEDPAVTDGDRVNVTTGYYLLGDQLDADDEISIGGTPSAVPTIVATTPAEAAIAVDATGAELHDVTVVQLAGAPALRVRRGTADRVTAESDGAAACELGVTDGSRSLIRDGVCWSGSASTAAAAVTVSQTSAGVREGSLRNVTAWAAGSGGTGIAATASGGGTVSIDALNVIASGTGDDIRATAAAGSSSIVSLTTSNFAGVATSGAGTVTVTSAAAAGNQSVEPTLADPDNGNFDQLVGSPTIDAGSQGTLLGGLDIGGEPRVQGPEPDIGADERDGTPPRTAIESGPAAAVKTGRVTFAFSSDEPGSTFECRIDEGDYKRCSSPFTTDTLNQGDHVFSVRATDPAGNVEPTPASRYFTVDKVISGANVAARSVQRLRGRRVSVALSVRSEELTRVRAGGTLRAGDRRFRLESKQRTLVAGGASRLTLTPKQRNANRKIVKLLRRHGAGEAALTATFIDSLGNRATSGDVDVRVRVLRGK